MLEPEEGASNASVLLGEIARLREALRLIADGHIDPAKLARLALDSPHGIAGSEGALYRFQGWERRFPPNAR